MNFDKYAPLKEQRPPLKSWQDSPDVIRLFEYLKLHTDRGIALCQTEGGVPCLVFEPGLQKQEKNPERWATAEIAEGLFVSADVDLKKLMVVGLLTLPTAPLHRQLDGVPDRLMDKRLDGAPTPHKKQRVLPAHNEPYG